MEAILKATIDAAMVCKAIKPAEFERIIADTTVQEKAIAYPVDSRLLEIARYKVVKAAKGCGLALRQTFAKEGKTLAPESGRLRPCPPVQTSGAHAQASAHHPRQIDP